MSSPTAFLHEVRKHLGYGEPPSGVTPYGQWYAKQVGNSSFADDPWCDMFLSYCGDKTGSPIGRFAYTVYHARWFDKQGRFNRAPRRGSLVFFDWSGRRNIDGIDHVGVVEQVRPNGDIVTIEGNTSNRVARRVRTMNTIVGFGHPNWQEKAVPTPAKNRKYRVVATTRFGGVRMIWRTPTGFSWRQGKEGKLLLTAGEAENAMKWAKKRAAKTTRLLKPGDYTHLRIDPGTRWPSDKKLLSRLNRVGRVRKRIIYIKSGQRSLAEQTYFWNKYQAYLNGGPFANKAAYPNPNAPHIRGVAADVGVLDRNGSYKSLGLDAKCRKHAEKLGLRAWVSGEPWHWQRRETY